MRGQYAHNTGVWSNKANVSDGGWKAYRKNGLEQDNVATRLDAAGYRTGLFGKYLNGYNQGNAYVPPGWDRWFGAGAFRYFDYDANDQGTIRHFGTSDSDYVTDVVGEKAKTFISTSAAQGKPFFAYVAPIAPHAPATPAARDRHSYDDLKAPSPPSFNEKGVSDKPPWIRSRPRLTPDQIAKIDKRHEARVETLQSLDDLVAGIVRKLKDRGVRATPTCSSPQTTDGRKASTAGPPERRTPTRRTSVCPCWCVAPGSQRAPTPPSWPSTPTTYRPSRTLRAPRRGRVTPRTGDMSPTDDPCCLS